MTRVLFLTESFLPVLGGGERHIAQLASQLVAAGTPCAVLTRRTRREWPREEHLDGVRVVRVAPSGKSAALKYAMVPAVVGALVRERRSYDVLVVRGGRVLAPPAVLAGRALGKAVVLQPEVSGEISGEIYTWGTPLHLRPVRAAVRLLVRLRNRLLRLADAFVAISSSIRRELVEGGLQAQRIALIPHGVDTERFRPSQASEKAALRERLSLPQDVPLVVYTGRLLRGKGLEVLLESFASLAHPSARLLIVGSGDGQPLSVAESLGEQAATPALAGRVLFAGRVDDVADHLRASDVFVFPSFFEALPLSVLEAAACGLPCVVTAVGGIVDVIEDGVSGRLVPPGDVAALALGLQAVLADPAGAAKLGSRARETVVKHFDRGSSFERYRELFAALGGGRA